MIREGDLLFVVLLIGHTDPACHDAVVGESCFEGERGRVGEGCGVVHTRCCLPWEEKECREKRKGPG